MLLRHLSILIFAGALAACGSSADTAPAPDAARTDSPAVASIAVEGPERRILAFGDSLFAGYGIGREHSYPAKLEAALREQGINAVITNAGISGETSGAGAQRLAFTLDAQEEKPDLVMLELGGNDMLRAIPPAATRANFEAMLEELKRRDIPVLLMGMRAPPNYGPEYQQEFDAIYGAMAQRYGAAIIPFWLEAIYQDPSLFQDDKIHPTTKGVDALVADTLDDVEAALPKKG
ncbi:arylesterase [Qipengyuania sp.]|uniref:arylesterase n=1 Tax=Qipengyuania sp. TaxID=2004515 RepID=UPI003514CE16